MILNKVMKLIRKSSGTHDFKNSKSYWSDRYVSGRNSGAGSYGRLAQFKASVLNDFVKQSGVKTVVEWGCGDGSQLGLAEYPCYLGLDVTESAIDLCHKQFLSDSSKSFFQANPEVFYDNARFIQADLALSLDVIYHLVEDKTFDRYMTCLFNSGSDFVIIYSSDFDRISEQKHVRHRKFSDWILESEKDWVLHGSISNQYPFDEADPKNTSFADFYIFKKKK